MSLIGSATAWVVLAFVGLLGLTIIGQIWLGAISLKNLISEPNGDASTSRLQFLIFTFVISLSLFLIVIGQPTPAFPDKISDDVLGLLGISGGSYLVSKGIQFSNPAGLTPHSQDPAAAGASNPVPVKSNAGPGPAQPDEPPVTFNGGVSQ